MSIPLAEIATHVQSGPRDPRGLKLKSIPALIPSPTDALDLVHNRVRRWTLEIFLPAVRGSGEENQTKSGMILSFARTRDEIEVVDDAGHGEYSAEGRCPVDIPEFR